MNRPKGMIFFGEKAKKFYVAGKTISADVANALFCKEGNDISPQAHERLVELGYVDEANEPEDMEKVLWEAGYR